MHLLLRDCYYCHYYYHHHYHSHGHYCHYCHYCYYHHYHHYHHHGHLTCSCATSQSTPDFVRRDLAPEMSATTTLKSSGWPEG